MGFVISTPGAREAADHLKFAFNQQGQNISRAKMLGWLRQVETNPGLAGSNHVPILARLLQDLGYFSRFSDAGHAQKFRRWLVYLFVAWKQNPLGARAYPKIAAFMLQKIEIPPYKDFVFDWEEIADPDSPDAEFGYTQAGDHLITARTIPLRRIGAAPSAGPKANAKPKAKAKPKAIAKTKAKSAPKSTKGKKKAARKAKKKFAKVKRKTKKAAKRHG